MIDALELKNCIISIDAMGCQRSISCKIRENKADYVFSVKDNQQKLHDQLKWFFRDIELPEDEASGLVETHSTFDMDHGRYERLNYLISGETEWLKAELAGFADVQSIGMSVNKRTVKGKTSIEKRYFISSLEPSAEFFATSVRSHWGVENKLYWVLDMVFKEGESRIRKGFSATNMTTIRKIAMNVIRRDKSKKTLKRKKAGWNKKYLEDLLFQAE